MTWVIAIAGFCALIVAHEAGHFLAAKAVGMRVERFSLFFPPKLFGFRIGETEYQVGALPLGGYVKITGMTAEELAGVDLRVADRSYYMKEPWKRIVVILAGPAVNLVLAFVFFAAVLLSGNLDGVSAIGRLAPSQHTLVAVDTSRISGIIKGSGASRTLHLGDRIVALDGRRASGSTAIARILATHRCAGPQVKGCAAASPVEVTVLRHGRTVTVPVTPHYSKADERMLLGVGLGHAAAAHYGVFGAIGVSIAATWDTATSTVTNYFNALVSSKVRHQLQSAAGITQDTQEAVASGPGLAFVVLGLVSLVLAVVNLFPFLPLDGGHVVWSLAEKVRGRRISISTMWRYSSVGVILLAFLVLNGISNDISRLSG